MQPGRDASYSIYLDTLKAVDSVEIAVCGKCEHRVSSELWWCKNFISRGVLIRNRCDDNRVYMLGMCECECENTQSA